MLNFFKIEEIDQDVEVKKNFCNDFDYFVGKRKILKGKFNYFVIDFMF